MPNPIDGPVGGRVPGPTDDFGPQAQTLSEARRHPLGILPRESIELTRYGMWGSMMDNMKDQPEARRQWYIRKLGKYNAQLQGSAAAKGQAQLLDPRRKRRDDRARPGRVQPVLGVTARGSRGSR